MLLEKVRGPYSVGTKGLGRALFTRCRNVAGGQWAACGNGLIESFGVTCDAAVHIHPADDGQLCTPRKLGQWSWSLHKISPTTRGAVTGFRRPTMPAGFADEVDAVSVQIGVLAAAGARDHELSSLATLLLPSL